ncbi:MAG TPA: nidogen-like domain-containing protein, partial [Polyangia bacterium]
MSALRRLACALSVIASLLGAVAAHAQASLYSGFGGVAGYGTQCLSPNDDGSSAQIDITPAFPSGLHFFTNVHTTAFVNTNGNITFSGRVSTYTPNPFPVANQPMIAPYWGDVDIRLLTNGTCSGSPGVTCTTCAPCHNPTENGVWWYLEPGRLIATWDRVGYFSCHNDKRMSFQLILTAAGCGGAGDFDVEFRYNRCEWETGDASGGSSGFGGTEAQAGFDAGNQTDYVAIPGSMAAGIAQNLCTNSNVGLPGIWRFQVRSGAILCPEAGQPCTTGQLGVCASGRLNCTGTGTPQCIQDVQPSAEVCDGLDNDCDGTIDEEDAGPLCPGTQVCDRGLCVPRCLQGVCPPGQVCTAAGRCVDQACVTVTCPSGERCIGGACVGACDGVVCPTGRACRAGRCVDLCQGLTCDSCTVCKDGLCAPRCQNAPCPAGETCQTGGLCVANACTNVTCSPGFHCVGGACVDNCVGAACPGGQYCVWGECVPMPPQQDAGQQDAPPPQDDAAIADDAGQLDAGQVDAP